MTDDPAGFTGSIPEQYDRGLGPCLFADYAELLAQRVAALRPLRVLETAAGTGIVTRRLRDLLPPAAQLIATDLHPPMLALAEGKFGAAEAVAFQPADAMALPFPDGAFDVLACQFGVMFFPDRPAAFREARRVLTQGGRYLFSVWDGLGQNAYGRIADAVAGALFPADPPAFFAVPHGYHRIDPIREALQAAGFGGLRIDILPREVAIPDLAGFARAVVFGTPFLGLIRARGGEPERVMDAVLAGFRAEFGPEPARMRLQAILFEADCAGA
ncbi:class I SAM-dependent methyltransferase [Roseicella frigidaeris]|uniref:Ubiquinone biosynthesis protein UbiE n=1 Tax=Roseicella frigidaeris TaxID=2230885 RepID=A0A327M513_9PROT|nr:methyltransferase domain-containing protein [Roseicella frigidaeris]RAI57505.1 ubiquinone biosynthesis protein UbiE [Roseicella frigidaeris]